MQVVNHTQKALLVDEKIYEADERNNEALNRIGGRRALLAEIYEKRGDAEKADFHRRKIEEITESKKAKGRSSE